MRCQYCNTAVIQRDVARHEDKCFDSKKFGGVGAPASTAPSGSAAVNSRLSALANLKEREGVPRRGMALATGAVDDDDDVDGSDSNNDDIPDDDDEEDTKGLVHTILASTRKPATSVGGALAGLTSLASMASKADSDR